MNETDARERLENEIRAALHARAAKVQLRGGFAPLADSLMRGADDQSRARVRAVTVAGAAISVAVLVALAVLVLRSGTQNDRALRTTVPTGSTAPHPIDSGRETPLALVKDPKFDPYNNRYWQALVAPGTTPFVVHSPGKGPMVIGTWLLDTTNTVPPPHGPQLCAFTTQPMPGLVRYGAGSCRLPSDAQHSLVAVSDTGPRLGPDTTWYFTWLAVPRDAAYVTFTYGTSKTWQRPVRNTAYFTLKDDPTLGRSTAVMRAFDANGRELAAAK